MREFADVPVRMRVEQGSVEGGTRAFVHDFDIGRDAGCDVRVRSGLVSRRHARVVFEDGAWWVCDDGSTNGTYVDGERIERIRVGDDTVVQLGQDGPVFRLQAASPATDAGPADASGTQAERADERSSPTTVESAGSRPEASASPEAAAPASSERPDRSLTQYIHYYFDSERDGPAGEHTRMLRQAYQTVQKKQRRQYTWVVVGVLVLCLILGAYAVVQHMRNERLEDTAARVFTSLKEQEVIITQLRLTVEEQEDAALAEQLAALEKQRRALRARYKGYIQELGLYRALSPREREIYRVARIFGESEFSIPAGFVRQVKETINSFWLGPARSDFVQVIQRAEREDYTPFIVETMQAHGLPPEFFYLALQESRFNVSAIGPRTRWGIAKGMWQFIPSTGRRYGLRIGPRADLRVVDPRDERHDFEASTRAAARYLQTIYGTKAQASGLLVIASYNWGEHRVVDRMEELPGPQRIPDAALEGIPHDPDALNYWQFLTEYSNRMPAQTKEYVLKIFSAAVIGQNPRLFGFDFDNPLGPYIEAPANSPPAS